MRERGAWPRLRGGWPRLRGGWPRLRGGWSRLRGGWSHLRGGPGAPRRGASPEITVWVVTLVAAAGLAGAWLAAPPMGTDLAAQVARADFFSRYGWAPIDFRWYAGVSPHGYSLVTPPLMAWFGPRPVGAAAAVVSTAALSLLLLRTGARRPALGGVLGAVAFTGNLVSGRITFAVGVALGLLALVALTPRPALRRAPPLSAEPVAGRPAQEARPGGAPAWTPFLSRGALLGLWPVAGRPAQRRGGRGAERYAAAVLLAGLAAAASPVAGGFVALAGGALILVAVLREPPRWAAVPAGGLGLVIGAAVPVAVMAGLFGSGGWMNMSRSDMLHATVTSLAVGALVPHRVVRVGALLSAGGVVAAYAVQTPVGLNATRLATMFALPLVAAYAVTPARVRRWSDRWAPRISRVGRGAVWLVPVLLVLAWWQPPVMYGDLADAGDPTAAPEYFAPLRDELARRQPPGRVEVVPTENYWESAYLGDAVPLARGWLRQADTGRNPLFFDGTLDAGSYRRWLADTGVSHVAVAQAPPSWVGRREAELIRDGLSYLTPVWRDGQWTLYRVEGGGSVVAGPATLLRAAPDEVAFEATEPGQVLLRVRWSGHLALFGPAGACLEPAGEWTTVRVTEPGRARLTGSVGDPGPRC